MTDPSDRDWAERHARIARASASTQAFLEPDEAAERRILDERARRLAKPLAEPSDFARIELAFFGVGRERFAIEASFVRRIGPLPAFEPIPWTSLPFLGVLNHHGNPLPVIDVRALLAAPRDDTTLSLLLVLGDGRDELGVAISAAEAVAAISLAQVEKEHLPESLRELAFIHGVYLGERVVLAGKALLEEPRLVVGEGF